MKNIYELVKTMNLVGKTIKVEDDKAFLKYDGVDLIFMFSDDKMIYVNFENGKPLFKNHKISLDLLRKQGVPMHQFYEDFYNKGFTLEDEFNNHYLYLCNCPIKDIERLNAIFNETEDLYEFSYPDSNLVFVIDKQLPLNELYVYDRDDEDKNYLINCQSDENIKSHGVDVNALKLDFKGFYLCGTFHGDKRIIE